MKNLKKFQSVEAYNTFAIGEDFIEPNVSMISGSTVSMKYTKDKPTPPQPSGYSTQYLTFVFSTTGSITPKFDILYLSNDNGQTWVNEKIDILSPGTKILVKGDMKSFSDACGGVFSYEGEYSVEGNIMSIYDSTGFRNRTTFDSSDDNLSHIFDSCTGLISAENLVLPVTALTVHCYDCMFRGCSSLTTAPELPATTLAESCYSEMFINCTVLNYIKCLATNISATDCTYNWVDGVSSTGTFVKNPNMSSWTTGDSGVPYGWTVQDEN